MKTRRENINADSGEKTWLTPKHIIDALGHFDTDPCCPPNMPWRTADRMLTKADDGTTAPWVGRVWLNPPYGREAYPFLERMSRYNGGALPLSLCVRMRSNGTIGYSLARIRCYSFADGFVSATRTGMRQTRARRLPHSSRIHQPTRTRSPRVDFAARL